MARFEIWDVYGLLQLYAGSNLQAALSIYLNTQELTTDFINLSTTTGYRLYLVGAGASA